MKQFREDLYFRLNVIPLDIPPLRERLDDIELLLQYSLDKFNKLLNKNILDFQQDTRNLLKNYHWPGNVRELENVVEYAVNMEDTNKIQMKNLPDRIKKKAARLQCNGDTMKEKTMAFQKYVIEECLKNTDRSLEAKRKISEQLGISESTLYRILRE